MSRSTRLAAAAFAVSTVVVMPYFGMQAGTSPTGTGYDTANRLYAVSLAALVWLLVLLRRRAGGAAASTAVTAAAVACAGVVLEFWIGPLQGQPLSGDAHRDGLPGSAVWWGSNVGFGMFALGALVLAVATVVWGVRAARCGALQRGPAAVLGATGPLVVLGFCLAGVGTVAAALGGAALALPWLVVAARSGSDADVAEPVVQVA
jgi:hypothetical protein